MIFLVFEPLSSFDQLRICQFILLYPNSLIFGKLSLFMLHVLFELSDLLALVLLPLGDGRPGSIRCHWGATVDEWGGDASTKEQLLRWGVVWLISPQAWFISGAEIVIFSHIYGRLFVSICRQIYRWGRHQIWAWWLFLEVVLHSGHDGLSNIWVMSLLLGDWGIELLVLELADGTKRANDWVF